MKELEWFVKALEAEFSVQVDRHELSYEGHILYLEEVDESLIPAELTKDLPEQLLFETMLLEDSDTEWLGVVGMDMETRQWYFQAILKNDEIVHRKNCPK